MLLGMPTKILLKNLTLMSLVITKKILGYLQEFLYFFHRFLGYSRGSLRYCSGFFFFEKLSQNRYRYSSTDSKSISRVFLESCLGMDLQIPTEIFQEITRKTTEFLWEFALECLQAFFFKFPQEFDWPFHKGFL